MERARRARLWGSKWKAAARRARLRARFNKHAAWGWERAAEDAERRLDAAHHTLATMAKHT